MCTVVKRSIFWILNQNILKNLRGFGKNVGIKMCTHFGKNVGISQAGRHRLGVPCCVARREHEDERLRGGAEPRQPQPGCEQLGRWCGHGGARGPEDRCRLVRVGSAEIELEAAAALGLERLRRNDRPFAVRLENSRFAISTREI